MTTPRILVVDDEQDVQDFLRLVLEGAGYVVESAHEGKEAVEKVEAFRPDLMVLDLMMPGMDGWEVLRRLRAAGAPPPVVVVLSAFAERRRSLEAGAEACLSKPFHLRELLLVCERALAGSGKPPECVAVDARCKTEGRKA